MNRRQLRVVLLGLGIVSLTALLAVRDHASDRPELRGGTWARQAARTNRIPRQKPSSGDELAETPNPTEDERVGAGTVAVHVVTAEDRSPMSGAAVSVVDATGTRLRGTTDDAGVLQLCGVAAGPLAVSAETPGRVESMASIQVRAGGVETVELRLAVGVIVNGVVLSAESAQPIAQARIEAQARDYDTATHAGPTLRTIAVTTVGPDGRFDLCIPVDVLVSFTASAHGFAPHTWVTRTCSAAEVVPTAIVHLQPGVVLRGTVTDWAGTPIADATTYVVRADRPEHLADPEARYSLESKGKPLRATTDAAGRYEVDGLVPDGAYSVFAFAPGRARSIRHEVIAGVPGYDVLDLTLRRFSTIVVHVVSASGNSDRGEVEIVSDAGMPLYRTTDTNGILRIDSTEPGWYRLTARAYGRPPASANLNLAEGEAQQVSLRFAPAVAISGSVVDDLDQPVCGALVHAHRPASWTATQGPPSEAQAISLADGSFRIDGLYPGTYAIEVTRKGNAPLNLPHVEAPAEGIRGKLARRGSARLRFRVPAGIPMPERMLIRSNTAGSQELHDVAEASRGAGSTYAFGDGFVTLNDVDPGAQCIRVSFTQHAPVALSFELAPGAAVDLGEVVVDAGIDLTGRVVDGDGTAITGASVTVGDAESLGFRRAITTADGCFRLPHMAPGRAELRVSAAGFGPTTIDVDSVAVESPLVVRLSRPATLIVRVIENPGRPAVRQVVALREADAPADARVPIEAVTDYQGRCEFVASAGRYVVSIPGSTTESKVELVSGRRVDLSVTLSGR